MKYKNINKNYIYIFMVTLLNAGCEVPGNMSVSDFISRSLRLPYTSTDRKWQTAYVTNADLTSTYADTSGIGNRTTLATRLVTPPALAMRGNEDYVMAFSQYDVAPAAAVTQNLFLAMPGIAGVTFSWPSTLAGFFNASADAASFPFSFNPQIVQAASGPGLLLYSVDSTAAGLGASNYRVKAWVRATSSNTWIGASGGTTAAAELTDSATATTFQNILSWGICPMQAAYDYAGGFTALWCTEDGDGAANAMINHYSPFGGWWSAPVDVRTYNTTACAAVVETAQPLTTGAVSVAPARGAGVAVAHKPDGSGDGWTAQVVWDGVANYTIMVRRFSGALQNFTDSAGFCPKAIADGTLSTALVVFTPAIFVKSSGAASIFYAKGTAGSNADGELMRMDLNTSLGTDAHVNVDGAPGVSNISFTSSTDNEYFGPVVRVSSDGSQALVAYATPANTIKIKKYVSASDTWTDWGTITSATGNAPYQFDAAINNSGDAVLLAAFDNGVTKATIVGYKALAVYGGNWDTGSAAVSWGGLTSPCDLDTTRISVTLDNNSRGIGGVTCYDVSGENKNLIVPFR